MPCCRSGLSERDRKHSWRGASCASIPFPDPEAVIHAPNLTRTQTLILKAFQGRRNQPEGQTRPQAKHQLWNVLAVDGEASQGRHAGSLGKRAPSGLPEWVRMATEMVPALLSLFPEDLPALERIFKLTPPPPPACKLG